MIAPAEHRAVLDDPVLRQGLLRAIDQARRARLKRAGVDPERAGIHWSDRGLPPVEHGTERSYNRGCKCLPCRSAGTEGRARRRHAAGTCGDSCRFY